ncbi:MAG: cytochrome c oxidase subunit II [Polyangiaceae bacterium]
MTLPQFALDLLALPPEASTASKGVDALHAVVISTTLIGALGVMLVVLRFVLRYRRKDDGDLTPRLEASVGREVGLSVGMLTIFMVFWVVGYRQYLAIETPPADAMVVYVTAKQWMWKFTYEDGRSTNDELVVPLGKPVKLIMSSRDVIHSFYVPAFRIKQDVLPGRYVTAWFEASKTGNFDVFCAEYCGTSHSNMHGMVRVLSPADFTAWKAAWVPEGTSAVGLIEQGAVIAARRQCFACHARDATAKLGPSWDHLYGSWQTMTDGRRVLVDDDYIAKSILDPNVDRVAGYPSEMPSYAGSVDADETTALVAYIRSLRGGTP